jgi:cystathionine beta-lyase/cystathionine gamma-synthase
MKPSTHCVHSGGRVDPASGGLNTPIYTSSAYRYLDREEPPYPRYFNVPNQQAVVRKLCALEQAEDGLLFSSGMAAISTAVLTLTGSGNHAIFQDELYGGTHAFVVNELNRLGVEYSLVGGRPEDFQRKLRPTTRLIYLETPSNPLLGIVDVRAVAEVARAAGVVTVIDSTFASPVLQNPLALGIDVVVHSGTKYLGGHSDLCCGAALSSRALVERMRRTALSLGGSLNASDCYLLERSLKTISIRVERQSSNAQALAEFLAGHRKVERVYYPGLKSHPGHEIARSQMRGFGGMLSFELKTRTGGADAFLRHLELITPALSLGGVESTICAPAATSHRKMTAEARARLGIRDGLLRLSVGIEDWEDLREDLEKALEKV